MKIAATGQIFRPAPVLGCGARPADGRRFAEPCMPAGVAGGKEIGRHASNASTACRRLRRLSGRPRIHRQRAVGFRSGSVAVDCNQGPSQTGAEAGCQGSHGDYALGRPDKVCLLQRLLRPTQGRRNVAPWLYLRFVGNTLALSSFGRLDRLSVVVELFCARQWVQPAFAADRP